MRKVQISHYPTTFRAKPLGGGPRKQGFPSGDPKSLFGTGVRDIGSALALTSLRLHASGPLGTPQLKPARSWPSALSGDRKWIIHCLEMRRAREWDERDDFECVEEESWKVIIELGVVKGTKII